MIFELWLFWPAIGFAVVALASSVVALSQGLSAAAREGEGPTGGVAMGIAVVAALLCLFSLFVVAVLFLHLLGGAGGGGGPD